MKHYLDNVVNTVGQPVAGASVAINVNGGGLATIYSDNGVTTKANPIITDSLGRFDFFVADGRYDLTISGPNFSTTLQANVEIADITQTFTADASWQTQNLELINQTTGITPPAGFVSFYSKTPSKHVFVKDDTGLETDLFAGVASNLLTTNNTWSGTNTFQNASNFDSNAFFKGPNPWSDITQYGARLVNIQFGPAFPGTTANCTSGNTTIAVSSSIFVNGDGVTLWGCGAPNGLGTPGTPTVVPSVASGPTGTGMVVAAPAGGTAFQYQIVAVDKNGGYTPAGSVGTTATGNALGWQFVNLTSCSKSNNTVTCITASPHGLTTGASIRVQNTGDTYNYGGWYLVSSAADTTHFTYKTATDTRAGAPGASVTGGTVGWFNSNHITWSPVSGAFIYLIYGSASGSMALIGLSKIQNTANGITDASYDDFGVVMRGTPTFLTGQYPLTPPISGRADSLTTTVASGGGTTALVLTNAPTTSVSGATILLDAAPAMNAALAATGNVFIPYGVFPNGIVINSYVTMPSQGAIFQQGGLIVNGTIELSGTMQWYGNVFPQSTSVPSFANGGGAGLGIGTSIPGIFNGGVNGTLKWRGLNVQGPNNSIHVVLDNMSGLVASDLNFSPPGGQEGMTMPVLVRSAAFEQMWSNVTFLGAQTGNSSTPLYFCNGCATLRINLMNLSGRGIAFNGVYMVLDYGRKQGGTCPAIFRTANSLGNTVGGVADVNFTFTDLISNYELDTDPNPLVATVVPLIGNGTALKDLTITGGGPFPSVDTGGALPLVSGNQFSAIWASGSVPAQANVNSSVVTNAYYGSYGTSGNTHPTYGQTSASQFLVNQNVNVGAGNGLTVPFSIPVPTAAVTTTGCSTFPAAGSYKYQLAVVGPDGVQSQPGNFGNTITLDGATQCGLLTWTDVPGVLGYKAYVTSISSGNGGELAQGTCNSFNGAIIKANTCTDVHTFVNTAGNILNGTGNPSLYPGLLTTNKLALGSASAGNYGSANLQGNFSATRTVTVPDATFTLGQSIINGTSVLGTGAISATTCASAVTTAASGTASTDGISWAFNAAPTGAYTTGLVINAYVTTNNVNFLVCNPTAGSLTPPAATLNWRINR